MPSGALIALAVLVTLFLSQRFWYRAIWRITARWRVNWLRYSARGLYCVALVAVIAALVGGFRMGTHGHLKQREAFLAIFAGLWFSSALFAFLAVEIVHGIERIWNWYRKPERERISRDCRNNRLFRRSTAALNIPSANASPILRAAISSAPPASSPAPRRFAGAVYGFATERLSYRVRRIEIPIANLPPALDGMKIAQISDIHMSALHEPRRRSPRRGHDQRSRLRSHRRHRRPHHRLHDPIEDCVEEVSRLHAPLGVWGCNGNHEIYADAEQIAAGALCAGTA